MFFDLSARLDDPMIPNGYLCRQPFPGGCILWVCESIFGTYDVLTFLGLYPPTGFPYGFSVFPD
jgi:hypothetical protein